MPTIYLPEGDVTCEALLDATAATVPDIRARARFKFQDGWWPETVELKNRDQARTAQTAHLVDMAARGEIRPKSRLTNCPLPEFGAIDVPAAWLTWAEAQAFCALLGLDLEPGEPAHVCERRQSIEPLPAVVTAGPGLTPGRAIEDRQARRLLRLRELGGDRVRQSGEWKTTGKPGALKALCAEEKAARCSPFDEKAIRRDVTEAAEREREGRTASPFPVVGR